MTKAGDQYRELVGAVAAALEPTSVVKTEQWIDGPDGERDMDVEIRGILNGRPHFVLIECKDHSKPIGIGYVDALESKIRDLVPDRAIMFSNSGFSRDAMRKAQRVGIEMASAMKANDKTIRIEVHRDLIARRLSLRFDTMRAFPFDGHPHELEHNWQIGDLLFDRLPVINWASAKIRCVASQHDENRLFRYLCTFRPTRLWSYHNRPIMVGGLVMKFDCIKDWVSQTVRTDVSLGYYDHQRRSVAIPDKQWYSLGRIDNEAWTPTDEHWDEGEMEPNSFRLNITLFQSNLPGAALSDTPAIDNFVAGEKVEAAYSGEFRAIHGPSSR